MNSNHILTKYRKENIRLIGSLVIKLDYIGVQDNLEYITLYGDKEINLYDKSTWRYYVNLSGEYHVRDTPIKIKVLETGEEKTLTKELLERYTETKKELQRQGSYYKELLNRYPRQITLINSILYPTSYSIEELIELEDGAIVGYDYSLIEDNEYNVIEELNRYSINFFTRWYNREYVYTDNLYLTSILGTLYSKLLLKLFNIRYNNIHTYRVHSFYLELFFRSNLTLSRHVHVLNRESKIWLYRNLRYLRNNIGKDITLQRIIDNICSSNGVGVGEVYHVVRQGLQEDNSNRDFSQLPKPPNSTLFQYVARNKEFILLKDKTVNYKTLLGMELYHNDTSYYLDNYSNSLKKHPVLNRDRTKDLILDEPHTVNLSMLPKLDTIIDAWFSSAIKHTYTRTYSYIDVNTGIPYMLTPIEGMLFFIRVLYDLYGYDNKVFEYRVRNIPDYTQTLDTLTKNIYQKDKLNRFVNYLLDKLPTIPNTFVRGTDIKGYIEKLDKHMSNIQLLLNNMNDGDSIGSSLKIIKGLFRHNTLHICEVPTRIDELLQEYELDIVIDSNYNHLETLLDLVTLFTGYSKEEIRSIDTSKQHFKAILDKLTSYTVRVLDNGNLPILKLGVPSSTIDVVKIDTSIISIKSGSISCLEEMTGTFSIVNDDILYSMEAIVIPPTVRVIESNQELLEYNTHNTHSGLTGVVVRPTVSIERVSSRTRITPEKPDTPHIAVATTDQTLYNMESIVSQPRVKIMTYSSTVVNVEIPVTQDSLSAIVINGRVSVETVKYIMVGTKEYEVNGGGNVDGSQSYVGEY